MGIIQSFVSLKQFTINPFSQTYHKRIQRFPYNSIDDIFSDTSGKFQCNYHKTEDNSLVSVILFTLFSQYRFKNRW